MTEPIKERIPENSDRLNQACKQALFKLKQQVDTGYLYCLQLAEWQAEQDKDHYLQDMFLQMFSWKPESVMYRMTHVYGDETDPVHWAEIKTSEDLAVQVYMSLEDVMMRIVPNYPFFR